MTALDRDLNQAILLLAPNHTVSERAPATFAEIMRQGDPLTVWSGASDGTIYDDPAVNWAFRAWHDATHIAGQYNFTLAGEIATCEAQLIKLRETFPRFPARWETILRAEIIGQAQYAARFGSFPTDQAAFIREALTNGTL